VISSHQDFSERDWSSYFKAWRCQTRGFKDPKACARLWPSLTQRFWLPLVQSLKTKINWSLKLHKDSYSYGQDINVFIGQRGQFPNIKLAYQVNYIN